MSGINIQTLVEGESNRVVIQSTIGRRIVDGDRGIGQASNKFLDISDTQCARNGGAKSHAIPEYEVEANKGIGSECAGSNFCDA